MHLNERAVSVWVYCYLFGEDFFLCFIGSAEHKELFYDKTVFLWFWELKNLYLQVAYNLRKIKREYHGQEKHLVRYNEI